MLALLLLELFIWFYHIVK